MDKDIFINVAYDAAMKKYLLFRKKQDSLLAGDFLVYVICMLIHIYNEADIINPFINQKGNGKAALLNNLQKFNVEESVINKFFKDLLAFYELDNYNKIEKKYKNDFFTFIQEDLIDMFLAKYQSLKLSDDSLKEFRKLLFSSDSNNPFKKAINDKYAINKDGALNYFNHRVYSLNNVLEYRPIKNNVLSKDIYQVFGLNEEDIDKINQDTLNEINKSVYAYFNINPIEVNAKDKLVKSAFKVKNSRFKLVNNAGKMNMVIFFSFFSVVILVGIILGLVMVG